jgi:transposase InsO family protein
MTASKKETIAYESKLAKLKENKQLEVSQRFEVINPILILERIKEGNLQSLYFFKDKFSYLLENESERLDELTQNDLIDRIEKHTGKSRATIMRYLAAYRANDLEGLISNKGYGTNSRKDNRLLTICDPDNPELILDTINVRLSDGQIKVLKEVIEQDYLTKLRISKAAVHRILDRKCMKHQVPDIKYVTICGIIDRIDEKVKETRRNPSKAKRIYDEVARGYADRDALGRLDIVQIDHTKLDIPVIDDATGQVISRPWLTLGLCVHSREPWCMYLSAEGPSENVVRKAIQHGVFLKNTVREYGTQKEWAASGIPNIIYVDNGMDFKSNDIKRLVNETLKSNLRHRPVRLPHYGALIERLFGTINRELIHNIWGTTKSNIVDKGDLDPEREAFLKVSQLREILIHYLVDIYPYKPHRGLPNNLSPRVRYMESVQEMGYPDIIFEDEKARYEIDFLHTEKKSYTRDGVRWENRIYKSNECQDIIGTRLKKYSVKYDIDDIGVIYLLHPKNEKFIKLHCESPPYEIVAGVSRYTYKLMEKELRQQGEAKLKEILDEDQIKKGWEAITKKIKEGYVNHKSVRQQVAKMGNVKVEISAPYSEHQAMQQRKTEQALSFEEQLILKAKQAEELRRRNGG